MNPLLWPRWAQGVAILAVILAGFLLWLHFHDKGVIERHEEEITQKVDAVSSDAAASASAAVDQSRNIVEKANEDAREAAADSDDPLKSGLDSIRSHQSDDR